MVEVPNHHTARLVYTWLYDRSPATELASSLTVDVFGNIVLNEIYSL